MKQQRTSKIAHSPYQNLKQQQRPKKTQNKLSRVKMRSNQSQRMKKMRLLRVTLKVKLNKLLVKLQKMQIKRWNKSKR